MANKCTPKPASFDCFLITNNSQWESKICMYEKECWSCLCFLPRSLLLKQICTFCSPGIDTSSGWTRTLPACQPGVSAGTAEKLEGRSLVVAVVVTLKEGINPSRCPPLPAQTSSTWAHSPLAVGHIKLLPLSNNSVRNSFSRGVHCFAESQTPKQGTVLCDGAGESARIGLLSPLWWPHVPSPGAQSPCSLPSLGCVSSTSSVPQCPQPRNCTEISWIPLNSWL